MNTIVLLYLFLHIIGDFYLQGKKMARCKVHKVVEECGKCKKCSKSKHIGYITLVGHIGLYCIPFLFYFLIIKWYFAITIILLIAISHYIVDVISCFCKKKLSYNTIILVIDQFFHILILYFINVLFIGQFDFNLITKAKIYLFESFNFPMNAGTLKKMILLLILIKPASIFIDTIFSDIDFSKNKNNCDKQITIDNKPFNVGIIIGIVERLIILMLVIVEAYPSIALIITIKTWARSKDLTGDDFREKYLAGTLLSLLIALLTGLLFKTI